MLPDRHDTGRPIQAGCAGRVLGPKPGPLLGQIPPSLTFSAVTAGRFFSTLRKRFDGMVVIEPRHPGAPVRPPCGFAADDETVAARLTASHADPPSPVSSSEMA
jgi:uncharacterized protein YecE (DUF72 family)